MIYQTPQNLKSINKLIILAWTIVIAVVVNAAITLINL